ncbi:MAG: hypothetical protein ACFE9P_03565 [Candidatus Hermodarchaeota archaeon]
MKKISIRYKKLLYAAFFFALIGVLTLVYNSQNLILLEDEKSRLHSSGIITRDREWIDNSDFSDPIDPWYSQVSEDISDINVGFIPGEGYFKVIGEEYSFSDISGTPISTDWTRVHNPEFPSYPDTSTINSGGCYVSHQWGEYSDQSPSVHWERNVSMPIDMSDYIITSASLTAIVNGSANSNVETPGDSATDYYTWDYTRFYVLLSDLSKSKIYEVAYYQTVNLGQDSPPITTLNDTLMTTTSEQDLIFYLSSVLSSDFQNFSITLGIRIWCEDNRLSDQDYWNYLYIKSCNLSFTYQKKIDQRSSGSWNQIGDIISGQNVSIIDGNLRFNYKIDQLWPTVLSPNSRLNILINNNSLLENIKLSTATSTFQEAKVGGFDVTKLLLKNVNISLSIVLFLGDTFPLNQNFTISITDVYLRIIYTEFILDVVEDQPWFFAGLFIISSMAAAVLTGLLIAYVKVWRFPIPVRKVRKHKKALPHEKDPDVKIASREATFKKTYHGEIEKTSKILKGAPLNGKIEKDKLFGEESKSIKK